MSRRLAPSDLLKPALLLGLGMIGLGLLISTLTKSATRAWYPFNAAIWGEIILGLVVGLGGAALMSLLSQRLKSLQAIREKLISFLAVEDIRLHHALILGLLAGLPEEILFRGAIQPLLGLPLTALIFGALHTISRAYFIYAGIAGLILGALALWRGDLWSATAAHAVYDAAIFLMLARYARAKTAE